MDFTKLLEVKDLNVSFKIDAGRVLAVNGVSISLDKGEVLGIVGESGSGKSVTAYSIMGILDKNGRVDSGKINYKGTDLLRLSEKERRSIRGNKISIIFQDAMVSMNPVYTIGNQLREAVLTHAKDPIKVATSSIENEIQSDIQRIASLKKGISNHPERDNLKKDLIAVQKKYEEDKIEFDRIRKDAIETLKKNEAKEKAIYKSKLPTLRKNIRDARKDVFKCLFQKGDKVTMEVARLNKSAEFHREHIKDFERRYKERKQAFEKFKKTQNRKNNDFYKKEKKAFKKALYHISRQISFEKAKVNALAHSVVIRAHFRPTIEAYRVYRATKFTKHEYYWECRSAFRETKWSANKKAIAIMKDVGITDPQKRIKQYPFEFSGGMLQRCMIAMALVQKPDILIADEPTTALDVTIQAQILDLLKKLQKEYGMAIIIITHDLGVVAQICDNVAIMYAGRIVERGNVREIFYNPQHEYTKGLLKSMPKLDSKKGRLESVPGNPVDLFCLPKGCAFCSRCSECMDICIDKYPEEVEYSTGHKASCWKMIKKMHDEGKIDIVKATPEGKPLVYNGAIIAEERARKLRKRAKEAK